MIFRLLPLMACCLTLTQSERGPDMYGIMNILYMKADPEGDGKITPTELASVYVSLDRDNDGMVGQSEFVTSWMALTRQSKEMANAYFQMTDIDQNGKLDHRDSEIIFKRFDFNGDGTVSAQEFQKEFTLLFLTVPFVVLMDRVDKKDVNIPPIDKAQFESLFASLPNVSDDGSVTKAVLESAWISQDFGPAYDADIVEASLDDNKDDVISKDELGARFDALDTNGDGKVNIAEMKFVLRVKKSLKDILDDVLG